MNRRTPRARIEPTGYDRMPQWTPLHAFMCTLAVVACGIFIVAAKRVAGTSNEQRFRQMVGWVMLVLGTAWTLISLDPKQFDQRESLPLHLCDVLRPIMAFGLIRDNDLALAISYYWGIFLNPQAMYTPDLSYFFEPRWLRYSTYWFFHTAALAIPMGMTFGLGYRPTWKGMGASLAATFAWLVMALAVNAKTDGNYGFVNHAPKLNSVIDILPRWPWYIVIEAVGIVVGFAAMTYPFEKDRRGTRAMAGGFMRKVVNTFKR